MKSLVRSTSARDEGHGLAVAMRTSHTAAGAQRLGKCQFDLRLFWLKVQMTSSLLALLCLLCPRPLPDMHGKAIAIMQRSQWLVELGHDGQSAAATCDSMVAKHDRREVHHGCSATRRGLIEMLNVNCMSRTELFECIHWIHKPLTDPNHEYLYQSHV